MPFQCSTTFYQFAGSPSNVYEINLVTGKIELVTTLDIALNAIAYNPIDNLIYGIRIPGFEVYTVDSDFTYMQLPIPTGLPAASFNSGTFDESGYYYLNTSGANTLYVIDYNPARSTFGKLVDPTNGYTEQTGPYGVPAPMTGLADIAWNTNTNTLCGLLASGVLRCIDPITTTFTDFPTGLGAAQYGAAGSFKNGVMIFPTNNTMKIIRVVNDGVTTDAAIISNTDVVFSFNDGTTCIGAEFLIDFGDAPDTGPGNGPGNYSTLLANNGPRHGIVNELYLGVTATGELDAYEDPQALGDDMVEGIQDDGVLTPVTFLITGDDTYKVTVNYLNNTGKNANLYGWIDFNEDGIFQLEESANFIPVIPSGPTPSQVELEFTVPPGSTLQSGDQTFMRLRLTSDILENTNVLPTEEDTRSLGPASDGEVEDYLVEATNLNITGVVWFDENCNGIREGGEPFLEGIAVKLFSESDPNNPIDVRITDASGAYSFLNMPSGNYFIKVELPNGYEFTIPNVGNNDTIDSDVNTDGTSSVFELSLNNQLEIIDSGLCKCFDISGQAFYDCNQNGVLDAEEPLICGINVTLFNSIGQQIGCMVTDCEGYYIFECLNPGDYQVVFQPLAGTNFTTQNLTSYYGSKPNSTTGIADITLTDSNILNVYAGFSGSFELNMKYCLDCNPAKDCTRCNNCQKCRCYNKGPLDFGSNSCDFNFLNS